jgi:hypothetical protein
MTPGWPQHEQFVMFAPTARAATATASDITEISPPTHAPVSRASG